MTALRLLAFGAAVLAASGLHAQSRPVGGARNNFPSPSHSNSFSWERGSGFYGGSVWVVEREVPVYVEVPVKTPPPVTPPPTPPPQEEGEKRKPYVLGASYGSLPASCMKLIEDGTSFFYCSGEWYRQEGKSFRAVARRL